LFSLGGDFDLIPVDGDGELGFGGLRRAEKELGLFLLL
jgi:hypothetical protein